MGHQATKYRRGIKRKLETQGVTSLTWVQWALLLKVRFLSYNKKEWLSYLWIQSEKQTRGPGALYQAQEYHQKSCNVFLYMKITQNKCRWNTLPHNKRPKGLIPGTGELSANMQRVSFVYWTAELLANLCIRFVTVAMVWRRSLSK